MSNIDLKVLPAATLMDLEIGLGTSAEIAARHANAELIAADFRNSDEHALWAHRRNDMWDMLRVVQEEMRTRGLRITDDAEFDKRFPLGVPDFNPWDPRGRSENDKEKT